ncbi:MAG: PAS domain S-box protein, partial [Wenzhouxiangellaceae bacterium]|nr:PAS domain S-box protein [Wenzhouxiangellaceae bacterium]
MIAINDAGPTVPAEGAEASRRRELGRLARAFEHLPVGMALQTPEGRWIDVNPEFCRMVGYSREVLLSLSFTDITDREDLQPSLDRLERLNRGELDHFSFEKRYRRADGKTIWVRLDVAMVRDERDRPEFIVTQATDITESRRMSDQLADREQRLSLALEGGKLGMWDWELASGGISFSRLAARMLGYSEGEVAPTMQAIRDLVHRKDQDRLGEAMSAHLAGRSAIFEVDVRMRRKSGAFIWVKARGKVTGRDAAGEPV